MHLNVRGSIIYKLLRNESHQSVLDDDWIKEDVVYVCNETLLSHNKEGDFCHLQQHEWIKGIKFVK